MNAHRLPYTPEESIAAHNDWKASCGHHSIAAACGVTLDAVKAACPKLTGWMSPKMISETLELLGKCPRQYKENRSMNLPPDHIKAVLRIQFEGPWTAPGRPAVAAYEHTHYVAVVGSALVMDTAIDASELHHWSDWEAKIGAYALEQPKCTGWHFTHIWLPNDF